MEVYKLPFTKPATGMEASAVVHSFLSQAEALGLQSSENSHMLIGLILSKMEDEITPWFVIPIVEMKGTEVISALLLAGNCADINHKKNFTARK